jgi:hypothetical protein
LIGEKENQGKNVSVDLKRQNSLSPLLVRRRHICAAYTGADIAVLFFGNCSYVNWLSVPLVRGSGGRP